VKFDVIMADCPWKYENSRMARRSAETQYKTMDVGELADLHLGDIAEKNCVLLLWAVPTMIEDALWLIKFWGFEYKTMMPWIKIADSSASHVANLLAPSSAAELPETDPNLLNPSWGMGWWIRGCFEPILIATRGKPEVFDHWIGLISPNFGHSKKPLNLHMYGDQFGRKRLELFARSEHSGWLCTGLELDGVDVADFIAYAKSHDDMSEYDSVQRQPVVAKKERKKS
jgi:N6-adenosine-specific RNA methylase IME4